MYKDMNGWQEIDARPKSATLTAELRQSRHKAHQVGLEFLQTELGLVEAFLDVAQTTCNASASQRNIQNAVKALDAIGGFLGMIPELPRRQLLAQRAAELRERLLACHLRLQAHE